MKTAPIALLFSSFAMAGQITKSTKMFVFTPTGNEKVEKIFISGAKHGLGNANISLHVKDLETNTMFKTGEVPRTVDPKTHDVSATLPVAHKVVVTLSALSDEVLTPTNRKDDVRTGYSQSTHSLIVAAHATPTRYEHLAWKDKHYVFTAPQHIALDPKFTATLRVWLWDGEVIVGTNTSSWGTTPAHYRGKFLTNTASYPANVYKVATFTFKNGAFDPSGANSNDTDKN